MTDDDWRDDPAWRLVEYDASHFGTGVTIPPQRPPAEAELAQPDRWCSLYVAGRIVATWTRTP